MPFHHQNITREIWFLAGAGQNRIQREERVRERVSERKYMQTTGRTNGGRLVKVKERIE